MSTVVFQCSETEGVGMGDHVFFLLSFSDIVSQTDMRQVELPFVAV